MDASLLDTIDFGETGRGRWLALARKAAGADDLSALTSRTDDGIAIEPLSPAGPIGQHAHRVDPASPWTVVQRVDDPDPERARSQALDDVAGGATGLALVFEGAPNAFGHGLPATQEALERVLDGVSLATTHIRVDSHPNSRATVEWLVKLVGSRRVDPGKLSLSLGIDPAATFAGTGQLRMSLESLEASLPQSLAHLFALGLPGVLLEADGRVYHNAGATEAQELGIMLATAIGYLRMFEGARQPLVYAAPHIGFSVAVDQDQFLGMAKIRALRRLWARAQEACGIEPSAASVHAETSWRITTTRDPETNILRGTIACFAAGAGGADSVSVLPYTIAHGLPDAFARRVARNTQLVLAQESGVGYVADPALGSGAVEALTDHLCEAAWAEMQRIEAEGGVLRSLSDGRLQARIGEARLRRAEALASGQRAIVGTTLYPLAKERPVATLDASPQPAPADGVAFCEALAAQRLDETVGGQP